MTRGRKLFVIGGAAISVVALAVAGWAFWSAQGSGTASAAVGNLDAPTGVTTAYTLGESTVHVSWDAVTAPDAGAVDGYYVQSFDGSSLHPACDSSPATLLSGTTCDDINVPDGTYTYTVTAVFHSWSAVSTPSAAVTVLLDVTPPDAPVIISPQTSGPNSGTFSNGVFNASTWGTGCTSPATICGTAADNAGGSGVQKTQLEIVGTSGANNGMYWDDASTSWVAAPTFFDAGGTTMWSYDLPLPTDGGYNVVAHTIDVVNLQSTDTTESITIDNTNPVPTAPGVTAAIQFGTNPVFVNNEVLDLTDSPTDTNGSGVRSVEYFFCSGGSGACTNGTSLGSAASSAGSWHITTSSPLPSEGPYRIVAVATDNSGNVSVPSAATPVTVDTTPPTVSRPIVNGNV